MEDLWKKLAELKDKKDDAQDDDEAVKAGKMSEELRGALE